MIKTIIIWDFWGKKCFHKYTMNSYFSYLKK